MKIPVAYSTANKDTRLYQWWMIVASKWLLKYLCARESSCRKPHLYTRMMLVRLPAKDKVFLTLSCSKRSLYLLDLLVELSPSLFHPAFRTASPETSILTCKYAVLLIASFSQSRSWSLFFLVCSHLCATACFVSILAVVNLFFLPSYLIFQIPFQIQFSLRWPKTCIFYLFQTISAPSCYNHGIPFQWW